MTDAPGPVYCSHQISAGSNVRALRASPTPGFREVFEMGNVQHRDLLIGPRLTWGRSAFASRGGEPGKETVAKSSGLLGRFREQEKKVRAAVGGFRMLCLRRSVQQVPHANGPMSGRGLTSELGSRESEPRCAFPM